MPQTPHVEKHFTSSESVRDIVIGMSDGLTVPFALAAGLSGAVESSGIIVTAGLAEVAAGAIAMGLGGYLAARTDAEHYASERAREERETQEMPEAEAAEVADVLRSYGLAEDKVTTVVNSIRADKKRWVDFMMRFELGLEEPDPKRASRSAFTIACSYIGGGLVPLAPYFFFRSVHSALIGSIVVTLLALLVFGYIKGRFTTAKPVTAHGKPSLWAVWQRRRRSSLRRRWGEPRRSEHGRRFGKELLPLRTASKPRCARCRRSVALHRRRRFARPRKTNRPVSPLPNEVDPRPGQGEPVL